MFCLKHKISINTKPIGFSILDKLHIGPIIVLGYFISDLSLRMGLSYFSIPSLPLRIQSPLILGVMPLVIYKLLRNMTLKDVWEGLSTTLKKIMASHASYRHPSTYTPLNHYAPSSSHPLGFF